MLFHACEESHSRRNITVYNLLNNFFTAKQKKNGTQKSFTPKECQHKVPERFYVWDKKTAKKATKADNPNPVDDFVILHQLDTVRHSFLAEDSQCLATTSSLKYNCNSFCKVRNRLESCFIHILQQGCK